MSTAPSYNSDTRAPEGVLPQEKHAVTQEFGDEVLVNMKTSKIEACRVMTVCGSLATTVI